jgi:ABC-2 type transport system permease protein
VAIEAPAESPGSSTPTGRTLEDVARSAADRPKTTRVVSAKSSVAQRLVEIWRARELLVYLVRTEIKVKYKNSFLGLVWSMVSPAMTLAVYAVVFGSFLHNGIPNFVIFLFSGLLLWNFFQTGVLTATGVIVNNAGLVKKVSFPREILALASIGSAGVFLFFQSIVMVVFLLAFQVVPAWPLLWLLLVALVPTMVFAAGLGILLAAVNVYMRDTQHLVTVLVGAAWFWACPIVYSFQGTVATVLQKHHIEWLFFVNPLTPIVMTFQRVLYNRMGAVPLNTGGTEHILPSWPATTYLWADAAVLGGALILFYLAMVVFGRLAGNFAEEL